MPRIYGALASVALVAVAIALALGGDEGGGEGGMPRDEPARIVSPARLESLAARLGHALYWAGERPSRRLEVREEGGNAFVRYLPPGAAAGAPGARFLTVGTYPVADPVGALRRGATQSGGTLERAAGAVLMRERSSPGSVFLAFPGSGVQVEVYDPRPGRSMRLVRAGAIRPVG